jgi:hypothetical protein
VNPIFPRSSLARALVLIAACAPLAGQQPAGTPPPRSDLDQFMAKVLERRDENWRKLHDFILSEREVMEVIGPGKVMLEGMRREFQWYVRDGFLIRSPVRANGAAVAETERKAYEERWMRREQRREQRRQQLLKDAAAKSPQAAQPAPDPGEDDPGSPGAEPRFISEAYFLRFRFEPGNYYLGGREQFEGREVVRIEYYPTQLFDSAGQRQRHAAEHGRAGTTDKREDRIAADVDRGLNKVSQVTLWIDPKEFQIVKFTFDNPDFSFLPGRSIVRVDEARAVMTMGVMFEKVWLPRSIEFSGMATLAVGAYRVRYVREFFDYRKAEVSAKIRDFVPKEPRP